VRHFLGLFIFSFKKQKIEIPGERILESVEELNFFPGINLEGLYNREALEYLTDYGIETLQTMKKKEN
jgi:hypothetical protein